MKYFGEFELNFPYRSEKENWNIYFITYLLSNEDFTLTMFEQYMIYDAIGMIGSVGGTVGMFIKFLDRQLTIYFGFHDLLSYFIFFFIHLRNVYWILYDWLHFLDIFTSQKVQLLKNKFKAT